MLVPQQLPTQLTTTRHTLQAWRADMPSIQALRACLDHSAEHLKPWIPFMRAEPRSLVQTMQWVEGFEAQRLSGRAARFAIWRMLGEGSPALAGEVMAFSHHLPGALEVGYWLDVRHTGQGVAFEATLAMLDALSAQGVERVCMRCDVRNAPSVKLARRLGARCLQLHSMGSAPDALRLGVWWLKLAEVLR